jgi:hypothetical protein
VREDSRGAELAAAAAAVAAIGQRAETCVVTLPVLRGF